MGLKFDSRGFTDLDELLTMVKAAEFFSWVERKDLQTVVESDLKGRYEISGDQVRARYGHSSAIPVEYDPIAPPPKLYFALTGQNLRDLQKTGLKPEGRAYVHLSVDESTAYQVGRHKATFPIVLEIDAAAAAKAGVNFYQPTKNIWLVVSVPPEYIRVIEPKRPAMAPPRVEPPPMPPSPRPRYGGFRR